MGWQMMDFVHKLKETRKWSKLRFKWKVVTTTLNSPIIVGHNNFLEPTLISCEFMCTTYIFNPCEIHMWETSVGNFGSFLKN